MFVKPLSRPDQKVGGEAPPYAYATTASIGSCATWALERTTSMIEDFGHIVMALLVFFIVLGAVIAVMDHLEDTL